MDCLNCGRESKKNELVVAVYSTREDGKLPVSSQFSAGFVHLKCPPDIGKLMRQAMERDYEKRIMKDNSPDATYLHPDSSKAAMDYVQEHYESKAE